MLAANGVEGEFIQGLSQHAGINIGRDNFFATMQGAPFLLAPNPFVFASPSQCFRYELLGFNPNVPIYGCPNRNPIFTFDYSNDPMFQFAEGLVDLRGAARGVGRGAKDLVVGVYDLAENVVGEAAYEQMALFSPDTAKTLFGPQHAAFDQTVTGLGQLGWDAANGVAYKLIAPFNAEYAQEAYGENLERLNKTLLYATGGPNVGAAERGTYTLTQLLLPGVWAKAAEAAKLSRLGRGAEAADAAEVARLESTVVKEANAQHLAAENGRVAETVAKASAEDAAVADTANITSGPKPCVGAKSEGLLYGKYRVQEFEGRRIYTQDIDIGNPTTVDPNFVNKAVRARIDEGASNLDLMREGLAPIGPDGRPINLHHVIGEEPGPMVELEGTTHSQYHDALHGLIEDGNSFRNIPGLENSYNQFRKRYWQWRSTQFIN